MSKPQELEALARTLRGAEDIVSALRGIMPARRWRHCREASRLAGELAARYGHPSPALVAQAALLHDVGRSWRETSLRAVSKWYGWEPDAEEWAGGEGLLHGPAGAAFASALGLPREGATAIRYHVTGRPGLTATDKVVMAADACEPGRPYEWAAAARETLAASLDRAVAFWVVLKMEYVRAAGLALHPRSAATLAALDAELVAEVRPLVRPFVASLK